MVFKIGLSPWRQAHSSEHLAAATGMEGGPFSKCGSRLGAAHIRFKSLQQLQGWRAAPFKDASLGRLLFKGARSGVKKMLV